MDGIELLDVYNIDSSGNATECVANTDGATQVAFNTSTGSGGTSFLCGTPIPDGDYTAFVQPYSDTSGFNFTFRIVSGLFYLPFDDSSFTPLQASVLPDGSIISFFPNFSVAGAIQYCNVYSFQGTVIGSSVCDGAHTFALLDESFMDSDPNFYDGTYSFSYNFVNSSKPPQSIIFYKKDHKYYLSNPFVVSSPGAADVYASSTLASVGSLNFGNAIIVGLLFLFVVAYIYNQFKPKKAWQS